MNCWHDLDRSRGDVDDRLWLSSNGRGGQLGFSSIGSLTFLYRKVPSSGEIGTKLLSVEVVDLIISEIVDIHFFCRVGVGVVGK